MDIFLLKHMHIWYFYVMEQVQKKAIHVTHCPTEEMVTDFFTKPVHFSLSYANILWEMKNLLTRFFPGVC